MDLPPIPQPTNAPSVDHSSLAQLKANTPPTIPRTFGFRTIANTLLDHRRNALSHRLFRACQRGDLVTTCSVLKAPLTDVNRPSSRSETSLQEAAWRGHTPLIHALLGLNVISSLAITVIQSPDIAINQTDNSGRTALIWAAQGGYANVISALINHGDLRINHADFQGNTALTVAAERGHWQVVNQLIHAGADVHTQNAQGYTPLALATQNGAHLTHQPWVRATNKGYLQTIYTLLQADPAALQHHTH